ncbi:MAG TPA: GNAT family N-acetyltransferase [Roseiflexaceae bacterium]|nr:GNAT family N-acetyltransferase [Roseiflexaceae bacterium]
MSYSIRLFEATDEDYASVASLYTASAAPLLDFEYEHTSPALLRHFHAGLGTNRDQLRCYLAFDDTAHELIGIAQYFPILWVAEPHHYWMMVRVHPRWQKRGIGSYLQDFLTAELASRGARVLMMQAHEQTPAIATWVSGHGFHETFRSWQLALDPRSCSDGLFHMHDERMAAHGITITTLADEQRSNPQWLARLYDLHQSFVRDIPVPDHPNPAPPLSWFVRYACANPEALPDGFFIAKDGERYIGESFVQRDSQPGSRVLHHKLTGVRHEGRGRGVATALKLKTIAYARAHGYHQITTWNESNNACMLQINQKLGFVRRSGTIIFKKQLQDAPVRLSGALSLPRKKAIAGDDDVQYALSNS